VLRTFDAILRLAEIDSGAARTRFAPVDLSALVERVADAYRPDIEAEGREFVLGPTEHSVVTGDVDLLAQALANLIENAMHHSPRGSPIRLSSRSLQGESRIEVEDKGPGIPASERAHVLEPFARLDASRSTPGSGLGLSIVSAIARLHGGQIILEDAMPGLRASLRLAI
jgi:signal transduction histidine kinase